MKKYIGIDIHRKLSQVWVMDEDGKRLKEQRMSHLEVDQITEDLTQFDEGTPAAVEATVGWM